MATFEAEVLDAARYLRGVRPLDPAELVEYTTAAGDEPAVKAILRDHAPALELVEDDAGRFTPAPDRPIDGVDTPLEALPEALDAWVVARLEAADGPDWASGDDGARLRARVDDLKRRYLDGSSVAYADADVPAYLLYHLPRSYAATWYTLAELAGADCLGAPFRVLDVGAGVGAHLAAIDDATPADAMVAYTAVEPSPLADVLATLADGYVGRNTHLTLHRDRLEDVDLGASYDLVVLGNVLSELDDPVAATRRALEALADDGALLAIAPADPRTSRTLRRVEEALVPPATVFSPTLRLWPDRQPADTAWSFVERPALALPTAQGTLAAGADDPHRYRNAVPRYSYVILRRDGHRRFALEASADAFRPLADLEDAVGNRVDLLAVKLSHDLASTDTPVLRLGDGSQQVPCFAAVAAETALNRPVLAAPYGAVVAIRRGLVLWNDDEDAFNVVLDDEALVERWRP